MNQQVTLKVEMTDSEGSRKKAMEIAAKARGVRTVAIQGQASDQLMVVGRDIDAANLTKTLRKKVGHTSIISVKNLPGQGNQPPADQGRRCTCDNYGTCEFCRSLRAIPCYTYTPVPPNYHYYYAGGHDPHGENCSLM